MQSKTHIKNLYLSHPAIAKEWHPTKNAGLTPRDMTLFSNRKVWWLCPNEHIWSATINERIHGSSCPYCSGKKIDDENIPEDLSPLQPSQAKESYASKNDKLTQQSKEAHFKKEVSHEDCLQTVNPNLAKEWHPKKNAGLTPKDVTVFSREQVWWLCSKGHEWKAPISSRNNGQGCFYCSYVRKKHS